MKKVIVGIMLLCATAYAAQIAEKNISAVNNNRVLVTGSGVVTEAPAITPARVLSANGSGIPISSTVTLGTTGAIGDVLGADVVGLLIKEFAGATSNPFELRNSSNSLRAYYKANGTSEAAGFFVADDLSGFDNDHFSIPSFLTTMTWSSGADSAWTLTGQNNTQAFKSMYEVDVNKATNRGVIIKGFTSQTADLQQWQDGTGTVLSSIGSDGRVKSNSGAVTTDLNVGTDDATGGNSGSLNLYAGAPSVGGVPGFLEIYQNDFSSSFSSGIDISAGNNTGSGPGSYVHIAAGQATGGGSGGDAQIITPTASGGGASGNVYTFTGANTFAGAPSGDIGLTTGTTTGGGARGTIRVKPELRLDGSTSGYVGQKSPASPTSYTVIWPAAQGGASTMLQNDGSGNLSWAAGGGGGANTALSNLASVAINTDLIFANIGAPFTRILQTQDEATSGLQSNYIRVKSGNTTAPAISTGLVFLESGDSAADSGGVTVHSGTATSGSPTGGISIYTSPATNATSGGIDLVSGDVTSSGTNTTGDFSFTGGQASGAGVTSGGVFMTTGVSDAASGPFFYTTGQAGTDSGGYEWDSGGAAAGTSGAFLFVSGNAVGNDSGSFTFTAGSASGGGQKGEVFFQAKDLHLEEMSILSTKTTTANKPGIVKGASLGSTGAVSMDNGSTDISGFFTLTPGGTGIASGLQATITLFKTCLNNPSVVVTAGNTNGATAVSSLGVYSAGTSANTFTISTNTALVSGTAYIFNYVVICH